MKVLLTNKIGQNLIIEFALINKKWHPVAVGGIGDHVHILAQAGVKNSLAEIVASVKAGSSKFMKKKFVEEFAWQGGYGVFSVDAKTVYAVKDYILRQEQHHASKDSKYEFRQLLQRGGVCYADLVCTKRKALR